MSHRLLPTFKPGMQLSDMSASELSALAAYVEQLANLAVEKPLTLKRIGRTLTIGFERKHDTQPGTRQMVVVVDEIGDDSNWIIVQAVQYGADPPRCCTYGWRTERITAYPDYGYTPQDYSAFYAPETWTEEGFAGRETPFLAARYEAGSWIVEMPRGGTAVDGVVVRGMPFGALSYYLTVERVAWSDNSAMWRPISELHEDLTSEEAQFAAHTWGNIPAGAYEQSIWPDDEPVTRVTDILEMVELEGQLCVKLPNKIWAVPYDLNARHGGVRPAELE